MRTALASFKSTPKLVLAASTGLTGVCSGISIDIKEEQMISSHILAPAQPTCKLGRITSYEKQERTRTARARAPSGDGALKPRGCALGEDVGVHVHPPEEGRRAQQQGAGDLHRAEHARRELPPVALLHEEVEQCGGGEERQNDEQTGGDVDVSDLHGDLPASEATGLAA